MVYFSVRNYSCMNRILTGILCLAFLNANAQEGIIDSIKKSSYTGMYQSGEMNEILYLPYFTTNKQNKKNFTISQINTESLQEENVINVELPESYELKTSTFNGAAYILHFYDNSKKEDVLITTELDGNIKGKAQLKGSSQVVLLGGNSPEGFIAIQINKRNGYKVSMFDMDIKPKWEKSFKPSSGNWDVVGINANIERIMVVRKESSSGNKYVFTTHAIQPEMGETVSESRLQSDEIAPYPTFFTTNEGISISGGVYYNGGMYNESNPDGVFMSMLAPDGGVEQIMKVPYSQVIEDLKNTVGDNLTKRNSGIAFTSGVFSHELQQYIMVGEIFEISKNERVGGTVTLKDIVLVSFDFELKYKGSRSIALKNKMINLKGDLSKTNKIDIGTWLSRSSITRFKYFYGHSANAIAYTNNPDGADKLCYKSTYVDSIDGPCFEITQMIKGNQNTFMFDADEPLKKPVFNYGVLPSAMNVETVTTFEYDGNLLFLRKITAPPLEDFMVDMELANQEHDPPMDEEPPAEEPQEPAEE